MKLLRLILAWLSYLVGYGNDPRARVLKLSPEQAASLQRYPSTWQRHKAKRCLGDCYYCLQEEK